MLSSRELITQQNQSNTRTRGGDSTNEHKHIVMIVMNELRKSNTLIHKNDIFNSTRGKLSIEELDKVLSALCDDGQIHSAYDNDIYSVTVE